MVNYIEGLWWASMMELKLLMVMVLFPRLIACTDRYSQTLGLEIKNGNQFMAQRCLFALSKISE
jgi:hypothetical protein